MTYLTRQEHPKLLCRMRLLLQPAQNKNNLCVKHFISIILLTLISDDVSIYLAPIKVARSHASTIETGLLPFFYKIEKDFCLINQSYVRCFHSIQFLTCNLDNTDGSVLRSACVPISRSNALDLENCGTHFILMELKVSGFTTEKHNKNMSLSG